VAVAAAQYPVYHGYRTPLAYSTHLGYRTHPGYVRPYGFPYSAYSHVYRGKREAEAEPQPEAEADAEAEPGTVLYKYNTLPYVYNPHYAPYYTVNPAAVKVKSDVKVPASTYPLHYAPTYLPYAGAYGHHTYGFNPYTFNPYHPYVLKPVEEKEADEPTAATSEEDEAVEISRKRREAEPEAEAEAEADPATKVVTHHVRPYPYTHLSPYTYAHVAPKVVKTYTAAHTVPTKLVKTYSVPTYTGYPYYSGYYGHPGYVY